VYIFEGSVFLGAFAKLRKAWVIQKLSGMYRFNTGRFLMFSVITNIYNKKTKRRTLMELFTATGKLKKFFFF
jgi:hypothetical protein